MLRLCTEHCIFCPKSLLKEKYEDSALWRWKSEKWSKGTVFKKGRLLINISGCQHHLKGKVFFAPHLIILEIILWELTKHRIKFIHTDCGWYQQRCCSESSARNLFYGYSVQKGKIVDWYLRLSAPLERQSIFCSPIDHLGDNFVRISKNLDKIYPHRLWLIFQQHCCSESFPQKVGKSAEVGHTLVNVREQTTFRW